MRGAMKVRIEYVGEWGKINTVTLSFPKLSTSKELIDHLFYNGFEDKRTHYGPTDIRKIEPLLGQI